MRHKFKSYGKNTGKIKHKGEYVVAFTNLGNYKYKSEGLAKFAVREIFSTGNIYGA